MGVRGRGDRRLELAVGDVRVLLLGLAGCRVNDCVLAQLLHSSCRCVQCPLGIACVAVAPAPSDPGAPRAGSPIPSRSSGEVYSTPTPSATAGWVTRPRATLMPSFSPGSLLAASVTP